MTVRLGGRRIGAIVLDVEGTTTPTAFVYDVLFPFARSHLREYLHKHANDQEVRDAVTRLRAEQEHVGRTLSGPPADIADYIEWLMDRDRKSPGLKLLQGLIWREGFRSGELRGQVFPDVPKAFERWRLAGIDLAIFSSGSVLAQRLLFSTTPGGDLTRFISSYFDTAVGDKVSAASYEFIASSLGRRPEQVLFISDVAAELRGAAAAGYQVLLSIRPGNRVESETDPPSVRSFDEIEV